MKAIIGRSGFGGDEELEEGERGLYSIEYVELRE